jgi:hypothetical protein
MSKKQNFDFLDSLRIEVRGVEQTTFFKSHSMGFPNRQPTDIAAHPIFTMISLRYSPSGPKKTSA